ncbi:MAG: hypothetical protein IJ629_01885 [Clostridia bacterium]|nr:hypothetical protein [Clostridia bacterium]
MEEEEVIKEIEHDDNCFWSYVGSLLGGLIGTIPWIMLYYFYSFNLGILPAFIPIMAVAGYKFFKGIVNGKTFRTIVIISIAIFVLTLALFFPYILAQKESMTFDQFKKSTAYTEYSNHVLNNCVGEFFAMAVGLLFAYAEIASLLRRYEATNNMIKDMNTFIRKDNNPIDGNTFSNGGIRFTDKDENPIMSSDITVSNASTNRQTPSSNNVWENKQPSSMNRAWSNRPYINPNLNFRTTTTQRRNNYEATKMFISLICFALPIILFLVISFMAQIAKSNNERNDITSNYSYYDDYYDYYQNQYSSYNANEFLLEEKNIKFTVPEVWQETDTYGDNYIYLTDDYGQKKILLMVIDNDYEESLEEAHEELLEDLTDQRNYRKNYVYLNRSDTYYSIVSLENGYYSVLFTMQYDDYFIILYDYEVESVSLYDYMDLLRTIDYIE